MSRTRVTPPTQFSPSFLDMCRSPKTKIVRIFLNSIYVMGDDLQLSVWDCILSHDDLQSGSFLYSTLSKSNYFIYHVTL